MQRLLSTLDQCRMILRVASWIVPRAERTEWRREWEAEVSYTWAQLSRNRQITPDQRNTLRRRCCGAFADAAWHRFNRQDLTRCGRHWSRTPNFSLLALATVLLFVITTSGYLPRMRSILWTPPYPDPQRIATVSRSGIIESSEWAVPHSWVEIWKRQDRSTDGIASYSWQLDESRFDSGRSSFAVASVQVEENLFQVFRVQPILGRAFQPGDRYGCPRCVVIGYQMWRRDLGSDPKVLKNKTLIDGRPAMVIGVLPEGFWFPSHDVGVWRLAEESTFAGEKPVGVVARLRPNVTERWAERELERSVSNMTGYPFSGSSIEVWPVKERIRQPLFSYGLALSIAVVVMLGGVWSGRLNLDCQHAGAAAACRWWGFFATKTCLLLLILLAVVMEFTPNPYVFPRGRTTMILESASLWIFSVGCVFLLWWSISDQQGRCRVCLERLALPARIGRSGCLLLGWAGTELVCAAGHGLLHVSETDCSWVDPAQWTRLDESWRALFAASPEEESQLLG